MQQVCSNPEWMQPIHPGFDYLQVEVIWQARHEMARTVADILARRTRFLPLNAQASAKAAPVVAAILAKETGKAQHGKRNKWRSIKS